VFILKLFLYYNIWEVMWLECMANLGLTWPLFMFKQYCSVRYVCFSKTFKLEKMLISLLFYVCYFFSISWYLLQYTYLYLYIIKYTWFPNQGREYTKMKPIMN